MSYRKVLWTCFAALVILAGSAGESAAEEVATSTEFALDLIEKAGISRGLCTMLGCNDGELALELARNSGFIIHMHERSRSSAAAARDIVDVEGLYVRRVVVEQGPIDRFPYADNSVDLVMATSLTEAMLPELSVSEVLRVLRPGGRAILGCRKDAGRNLSMEQLERWLKDESAAKFAIDKDVHGTWAELTKPRPAGMDGWTHWQHAPDNNPVSTDTIIKAPYRTQWLGKPYYIAMPSVTTAANGRVFTATGHIAHHRREEPWLNTLIARNGYNGIELWRRKLPDGYLVHRSAFIAADEAFYMMQDDGCLMLDPETGRQIDRLSIPEIDGEWKWMAIQDGVLYVLVGEQKDSSETTIVRTPLGHWSWFDLSQGYYQPRIPWGFGGMIAAYDLNRRATLWSHTEEEPADSRAMVLGGGKLFFYGPDSHIGCLDGKTGEVVWTNDDQQVIDLIEEGIKKLISTPGFRTSCYSLYTPDALFFEAQKRNNVVAVSTKDGRFLWSREKTTANPNLLYADGRLLVGIGEWGSTLALDPLTGDTIEDLGFRKAGCTRLTATPDSFFCRGVPDGLTRYDRNAKKRLFNGAARPGCTDGAIGANGLLYLCPWLCDCNLSLMGTVALCSADDFDVEGEDPAADRLELGDGDIFKVAPLEIVPEDWPTCRANNDRSAWSKATVSEKPERRWVLWDRHDFTPTAPTAAGGLIFFGGDDGKVRAVDAETGELEWRFRTAGPIMRPPTVWNGRAYVGSGDGYVYALEAATGRLLWRFRAAPVERKIMVYGALCSNWPVNSGVLVNDGVAYAAAGIIDYDGTYLYALDAVTGQLKWRNNTSGHLDKELRKGVSAQGNLTIMGDRLWLAGGNVVSPASYDLKTGKCLSPMKGRGGPASNRGEQMGVLKDNYLLFGGRLQYSAITNVPSLSSFAVLMAKADGTLAKPLPIGLGRIPPAWSSEILVVVDGGRYEPSLPACIDAVTLDEYLNAAELLDPRELMKELRNVERRWKAEELVDRNVHAVTLGTDTADTVDIAIAENAVLVVYKTPGARSRFGPSFLCALNPQTGEILWKERLSAIETLPGGLLVDRDGSVIVPFVNGAIVCYR